MSKTRREHPISCIRGLAIALAGLASMALSTSSYAVIIGGIDFPQGSASFADTVVSYSPGSDVSGSWLDPSNALGVPDNTASSLGDGGEMILRFDDNALTTSGDNTADLHVFEIGPVVEAMDIAISSDNINYVSLGVLSGQPTNIDIDPIAGVVSGVLYRYVRLRDTPPSTTSTPFGEADIDAVGAISTVLTPVPAPPSVLLLAFGLVGVGFAARFSERLKERLEG